MYSRQTSIINETGLHARPAGEFVAEAKKFACKITIGEAGSGKAANAKSIVTLLSLGLNKGKVVEIAAEGDDEQQAVDSLVALVEGGFGEK